MIQEERKELVGEGRKEKEKEEEKGERGKDKSKVIEVNELD